MVELVVTHPLVNILRGAMSILAAVVSHPYTSIAKISEPDAFGFRALKPAIASFPQFLEMLVSRLSSADHALCTNALQLINSLMRDAIANGSEQEWPKFIKRLQDLGVIRAVYGLMQSSALQDLAQPLLDFQALTKILLRKWREVPVDLNRPEHRRAVKGIQVASRTGLDAEEKRQSEESKLVPDWAALGFGSEDVENDFDDVGFLGMMDLADYVRKNEDGFQKILLEQSAQTESRRCSVAKASIAVTAILYEHFEIDKASLDDAQGYLALDSKNSIDKMFKPMLLQWSKMHTAGLQSFLRLWKATGAEVEDFDKVEELVRILLEAVIGAALRTKDVHSVEEDIQAFDYQRLRELQMELFELTYEDSLGHHLRQVREELNHEALQFIKEQRIRCLLAGAWFPSLKAGTKGDTKEQESAWGYVKLSHNRRYLHYAGFEKQCAEDIPLEHISERSIVFVSEALHEILLTITVDLTLVSSVISNVTALPPSPASSSSTIRLPASNTQPPTRISINGHANSGPGGHSHTHRKTDSTSSTHPKEMSLLTLHPQTHVLAAEWLDGLLMLLNQPPITPETKKLLRAVSGWGLKIRLLNVSFQDNDDLGEGKGVVPSREGLDEDYHYDVFRGT